MRAIEFPGTAFACVLPIEEDTKAFIGGDDVGDTKPEEWEAQDAVPSGNSRYSQKNSHNGSGEYHADGNATKGDDPWPVAVAHRPTDEVGVRLIPQCY